MANDAAAKAFSAKKAIAILLVTPAVSYFLAPDHQAVFAIFFTTLVLWFTEAVPLAATALLAAFPVILIALEELRKGWVARR